MTRVLAERELNRALLARQLLLRRARLPIPRALERLGGIQNQYAPNGYIRLWSCLDGFRRDDLTRALERRTVVQGTLMRGTIHLVSAKDYWPLAAATRRSLREWSMRVHKTSDREMRQQAARLRQELAAGPKKARDLGDAIKGHVGFWLDLLRVPPSGTWERRRADLYALADAWLPAAGTTEDEGLELLVRRYLGGFGPATAEQIAGWGAVPITVIRPVLERVRLRSFRDEHGRELVDLPRAPLPPADTPAPVRFLPTWDATLLAHARGTGILPEEYRPLLFQAKNPLSAPSFLVDGRVAGLWRHDGSRIVFEAFAPLPRQVRRELEDEAARLAQLFRP